MFRLSFESNHRVLLAQFEGILSSEDIEGLDKALLAFVSRHGLARGILDFSSVQANAVPKSFLVWRARFLMAGSAYTPSTLWVGARVVSSRSRRSIRASGSMAPPEGWSDWCTRSAGPAASWTRCQPGRLTRPLEA
jgi:hypothetical protein